MIALAALALVGVTGFGITGCSRAPAGATSSSSPAAAHDQAVRFAECMRSNGIDEFPDPSASGTLTIDQIANGSSIDTSSAAFKQALDACQDLQPAGFTGTTRTAEQQKNALKFAQCMRDHGIKDFPDPTPDGPLIHVNGAHSIPGFQDAVDTCRAVLSSAMGGQK